MDENSVEGILGPVVKSVIIDSVKITIIPTGITVFISFKLKVEVLSRGLNIIKNTNKTITAPIYKINCIANKNGAPKQQKIIDNANIDEVKYNAPCIGFFTNNKQKALPAVTIQAM